MSTPASALPITQDISAGLGAKRIKNNYFDGLQTTLLHKCIFFLIMLAFFFDQMDNANFTYIAPALMKSANMSMTDIGHITFCYFIAMTVGGLLGGVLSDFLGRRKAFLLSTLIFTVASVINGWTDNKIVFIIARAMTGFGIFSLMVCAQTYMTEMAPAECRGKWQGLVACVGFCAMPFIGFMCRMVIPISPEAWRYIFYAGGLGFIAFAMAYFYLPESPRWLVGKKRLAEAEAVVKKLTGISVDLSEVAAANTEPHAKVMDVLLGMLQPKYIKRTLVILILFLCYTPPGFMIFVWTGVILKQKGYTMNDALTATMIIQFALPVGAYFSSLISDRGGRKVPIIITLIVMAITFLVFGNSDQYWLIVGAGFCTQMAATVMFLLYFTYCCEQYPTRMRNTASGLQNAAGRLATAAYQPIVPIVVAAYGFSGMCGLNAALLILPAIVVAIWGVRTGGKSLEEIS